MEYFMKFFFIPKFSRLPQFRCVISVVPVLSVASVTSVRDDGPSPSIQNFSTNDVDFTSALARLAIFAYVITFS